MSRHTAISAFVGIAFFSGPLCFAASESNGAFPSACESTWAAPPQSYWRAAHVVTPEPTRPIRTVQELRDSVLSGMIFDLRNPDHVRALAVYRKIFEGDPDTHFKKNSTGTLVQLATQNGGLLKRAFHSLDLRVRTKNYPLTEALGKLLSSQVQQAGRARAMFFNPELGMGSWKKLLNGVLGEDAAKSLLMSIFTPETVATLKAEVDLDNDSPDLRAREKTAKVLEILKQIADVVSSAAVPEKRAQALLPIQRAMAALIHTHGFYDTRLVDRMKTSKDGLAKLNEFYGLLQARQDVVESLGYKDFEDFLVKSGLPTGERNQFGRGLTFALGTIEAEVRASATMGDFETFRVRHLTRDESFFRGALGKDCSARSADLTRALDPNYHYFTLTDAMGFSSGHVTLVLGTGKIEGREIQVAFIDKIQNIPMTVLPQVIEAVRQSVEADGYTLSLPVDLGNSNFGITNKAEDRRFIAASIKTFQKEMILEFKPHATNLPPFPKANTRAEDALPLRAVQALPPDPLTALQLGPKIEPWTASNIDIESVLTDLAKLKDGDARDKLLFIGAATAGGKKAKGDRRDFERFSPSEAMTSWIRDSSLPLSLRRTILIMKWRDGNPLAELLDAFPPDVQENIIQNIVQTKRLRNRLLKPESRDDLQTVRARTTNPKVLESVRETLIGTDVDWVPADAE